MPLFYDLTQLSSSAAIFWLLIISIWALIWKGIALWHCARNKQKRWFIAILILNTMGLLPIVYLIWFKPGKKVSK